MEKRRRKISVVKAEPLNQYKEGGLNAVVAKQMKKQKKG